MTQTNNRIFDDIAKLMTDAAGVAQGFGREMETAVRARAESFASDLDLVKREELEVIRDMAVAARAENEALKTRVAALEARLAALDGRSAEPTDPLAAGDAVDPTAG